jgi:hypothetical protein
LSRLFLFVDNYNMDQKDSLEEYVHTVMLEIMAVLWANGQRQLHVGGLMRILGVPEEAAAQHDQERIEINELFEEMTASGKADSAVDIPSGTTVH